MYWPSQNKERVSLSNLIRSGSLKGNSKKLAIEIEGLHSYKPSSLKDYFSKEPMWR